MGDITIGIDVGGTKIQAAAMRDQEVVGTFRLPTPLTGAPDVAAAGGRVGRGAARAPAGSRQHVDASDRAAPPHPSTR